MSIGSNIRTIRKEKGLSQVETSKKAGIAVNSLRLYEADKRQPNIETLGKIANALTVPLSTLIAPTGGATQLYIGNFIEAEEASLLTGSGMDSKTDSEISRLENLIFQKNLKTEAIVSLINLRIGEKISESIVTSLLNLNPTGQKKAADLVEDLAKIPDYQKSSEK